MSTDCRWTVDRVSTDCRPTVDRLATEYRPTVDRLSTDCRPLYRPLCRPLYRPMSRSTLPTVNKIQEMKHFKFRIHHHFFLINEMMMDTECIRNMSLKLKRCERFFLKKWLFFCDTYYWICCVVCHIFLLGSHVVHNPTLAPEGRGGGTLGKSTQKT